MKEFLLKTLINHNVECNEENYNLFINLGYPVYKPRKNCRYVIEYQPTINGNKLSVNQAMENSPSVKGTIRL